MRRLNTALIIVLLCTLSYGGIAVGTSTVHDFWDSSLEDITLRDDAFHGRGKLPFAEWWYFDAILDNGYSVTIGVRVFSVLGRGNVNMRLNLYDQGSPVITSYKIYPMKEFSASAETPIVALGGKQLIVGSYDTISNHFAYNVTYETPQGAVSLHFVGCTQGWKRQQPTGDWWVVVLPRANVTGTITLENTTMNVTGTGYHDHNWDVGAAVALHFGWFWGTFESSSHSVTWAVVYPTRLTQHPMIVVNEKNGGYLNIPPETIWFSAQNKQVDHFRLIPRFLNIETMTEKVFLVVNMEVLSVDHARFVGFINYWRYHVKCTGSIMMNGHMETIDGVFIAEYLRFR